MTKIAVKLPRLHPAQTQIKDSQARFRVVCAGRRFGKSQLCTALCIEAALLGGRAWWVVPVYATGAPAFRLLMNMANQIPDTAINRSDRLVTFPNGGTVQVRTADAPDLLRGDSLDLVVCDEAAFMPALETLWIDVLRPTLTDRQGRAIFISTPNGRNYFWRLFQYGQDPARRDWQSWQFPTSANPYISAGEIESARRDMPEQRFSAEFLAEFTEGGSVFRNVRELATGKPQPGPQPGHEYTIGVDWGRTGDYTVICVYDATERRVAHLDRFTGIPYDVMLGRVRTAIEKWRPVKTIVERNSMGQAMLETLQKMRLPGRLIGFTTTNESKGQLVDSLALALERRAITLLDNPTLLGELAAYRAETLPSGLIRYSAPAGGHDDTVMALMLAYAPHSESGPAELRQTWWVRGAAY